MELGVLIDGLTLGFIYAIVAVGFSLVMRTTAVLNFGQGCFVMVGGLAAGWALTSLHVTIGLAVLIGVGFAIAAGAVEVTGVILPLWRRSAPGYVIVLGTALVLVVLQNLSLFVFGSEPLQVAPLIHGNFRLGSALVPKQSVLVMAVTIALICGLLAFLRWSRYGIAMRACACDRSTARLVGISPTRIAVLVFCVTAALGGLAGVLIAPIQFASYTVAQTYTTRGFISAMAGGLGDLRGAIVGGLVVGLAETYIGTYFTTRYTDALLVGFVIVVILVRPQGLFTRYGTDIM